MRHITPPQLVDVRRDDTWHPGQLEAWRRRAGRWEGYVRYTIDVGARHLGWVDANELRSAD